MKSLKVLASVLLAALFVVITSDPCNAAATADMNLNSDNPRQQGFFPVMKPFSPGSRIPLLPIPIIYLGGRGGVNLYKRLDSLANESIGR